MSLLLTYSEIDTAIQNKMSGQAPDESKRLEAINTALLDLSAEYDIESLKREYTGYFVPDGRQINIESYIADLKKIADLRYLSSTKQTEQYDFIDDDVFVNHIGLGKTLNEYSLSYNNGKQYLKINSEDGDNKKIVHNMVSLTDNGTWSADAVNGDAANLTTDTVVTLEQETNIKFDVDVSQTPNNVAIINNSTLSSLDLADYVGLGVFRFWIYIPSVTNFTSVELRWGNSDSVYWSLAVTTQADGVALQNGWNFISIDWSSATQTGTVDSSAIDYASLRLNYASGYSDQSGVRVEGINIYLPIIYRIVYYTYFNSKTAAGTAQEDMTATDTDLLLIPRRYKSLIVNMALESLMPISLGTDAEIPLKRIDKKIMKDNENLDKDIGTKPKTPAKYLKIKSMW